MIRGKNINFEKVIQQFELLKKEAVQISAKTSMGSIDDQIQESFQKQKAPSDKSWAPLKPKRVGNRYVKYPKSRKILRGLEDYFSIKNPSFGRVHVTNDKYYTKFHYTGTKKMVDRRFLPFPGESVPRWEKAVGKQIDEIIRTSLIKMFGGR